MNLETYWALKKFGAHKKGDRVKIFVDNRWKWATYIGSGMFSHVFRYGKTDVFIYSMYNDPCKEILAFRQDCNNPHIPKMEKVAYIDGPELQNWDIGVYKSKLYRTPLLTRHGPAYTQMLVLDACSLSARKDADNIRRVLPEYVRIMNQSFVNYATGPNFTKELPVDLREAIEDIGSLLDNYKTVRFGDIHKRNLATDGRGRLILMDIIFDDLIIGSGTIDLAKQITSRELRRWKKQYE